LNNHRASGQVINVSSGQPIAIKEVVEKIIRLTSAGQPEFGKVPYREGENMSLYADISVAKSLLGWAPKVTLDQGLEKTIRWFQQ